MPEIFGALPRGGAVSDSELKTYTVDGRPVQMTEQDYIRAVQTGQITPGGATSDVEIARQNQPPMRPTGTPGSTSEAEFEAYRNAIQGGSSAVEGPTQRYLDYMKMFQQFDPQAWKQSDVRRNRPMSNELTQTGIVPSPVQPPAQRVPVTRAGAVSSVEYDDFDLDDFMSNLGRKAQSDSTPYLGRT